MTKSIQNIILVFTVSVIPYSIGLDVDGDGRCVMFSNSRNLALRYQYFVLSMYSVIPVWVTTTIYLTIARTISKKKLHKQFSNSSIVEDQIRTTQNRRIVLTAMLTLVAFVVCNLPARVVSVYLLSVNNKVDMDVYMGLVFMAYLTYPVQSTLNPILYSMMTNRWRKDMKCVAQNSGKKFIIFFRRVTGLKMKFNEVRQTEV